MASHQTRRSPVDAGAARRESPVRRAHAMLAEREGRAGAPGYLGVSIDEVDEDAWRDEEDRIDDDDKSREHEEEVDEDATRADDEDADEDDEDDDSDDEDGEAVGRGGRGD